MAKLINLIGQKFDKLLVLEKAESRKKHVYWKCLCDCGNICEQSSEYLKKQGLPRDCGCSKKINQKKKRQEEKETRLIGQRFGRLTVIKRTDNKTKNNKCYYWLCQCDCGNLKEVPSEYLYSGHTQSCGCLKLDSHLIDITGQRFGKLTVMNRESNIGTKWICKCDCGNIKAIDGHNLRAGLIQSCGCINYSIGEQNIKNILETNKIKYIKEYCNSELQMKRFDFAILDSEEKIIRLIEYDGEQHYKSCRWNQEGKDSLEQIQKRDEEKNEYAFSHNIPLVRIPYWERNNITLEMILGDKYLLTKGQTKV